MSDDNDGSYCGLDAEKEELERKKTDVESNLARIENELDNVNWKLRMKAVGKTNY